MNLIPLNNKHVDWDALIAQLPHLNVDDLLEAFLLLGASKNAKYLSVLEKYSEHQNPIIHKEAFIASSKIKGKKSNT